MKKRLKIIMLCHNMKHFALVNLLLMNINYNIKTK